MFSNSLKTNNSHAQLIFIESYRSNIILATIFGAEKNPPLLHCSNSLTLVRLFVLSIFFLSISQSVYASDRYEEIFALAGAERSATLEHTLVSIKFPSAQFDEIRQLISARGTTSDKLQLYYHELVKQRQASPSPNSVPQLELLQQCLGGAKSLGNDYLQALYYFYLSEAARDKGQHNISFENKLYCLDELKRDESGKYFEQSWMLYDIASEYYWFKDYRRAATLATTAFGLNGRFQPGDSTWFFMLSSNLAGVAYLKASEFDSARLWLAKTYELAAKSNDTKWLGISVGSMGDLFYFQRNYTEAVPYYQKAIPICTATQLWDNVAPCCIALANCYMQTGNLAPVGELLQRADDAIRKQYNVNRNYVSYYTNHINYYTTLISFLKKTNRPDLVNRYEDSLASYSAKDELTYSLDKKVLSEVQLAYRNKTLESEVTRHQLRQTRWILYSLIGTLIAVITIVVLLLKRRNLKQKLKQDQLEHKRQLAEEELVLALTEIKDFTQLVQEKNQLIEQFSQQMELLKQQSISIPDDRLQQIAEIKQSVILTEDDWSRFKQSFEKVHPGYLTRLKERFPDFTQAETRYCLLTKLDLSPREMTAMLGVTPEALRHIRFRLRRKLQDLGDDIHVLILSV